MAEARTTEMKPSTNRKFLHSFYRWLWMTPRQRARHVSAAVASCQITPIEDTMTATV